MKEPSRIARNDDADQGYSLLYWQVPSFNGEQLIYSASGDGFFSVLVGGLVWSVGGGFFLCRLSRETPSLLVILLSMSREFVLTQPLRGLGETISNCRTKLCRARLYTAI